MKEIRVRQLADILGGQLLTDGSGFVDSVEIDSRQCKKNSVFFALKGENSDGHNYLAQVAETGATAVVISCKELAEDIIEKMQVIVVDDTLKALHSLARWKMENFNIPVVAVTGSVGKTTTRDMIANMLASKYKVGVSAKNYNSETGLPLTVMSMEDDIQVAVLEMGMDDFGQIHDLAYIGRPNIAVITNVGVSHLEKLGSPLGICQAKLEVTDFFNDKNILIIPEHSGILEAEAVKKAETSGFKLKKTPNEKCLESAGFRIVSGSIQNRGAKGVSFDIVKAHDGEYKVNLPLPGLHNVGNFMLALEVASLLDVPVVDAIRAVETMTVTGDRMKVTCYNQVIVLNDAYNAAPSSMCSAIDTLKATHPFGDGSKAYRIAFLGGMNELGSEEVSGHLQVAEKVLENSIDQVVTVGDKALIISDYLRSRGFDNVSHYDFVEDACENIGKVLKIPSILLLKGSRSYRLEKIEDAVENFIAKNYNLKDRS